MFTLSFVDTTQSKEKNWLKKSAEDAGLDLDEELLNFVEGETSKQPQKKIKREIESHRSQLKKLLNAPVNYLGTAKTSNTYNYNPKKAAFVVVAR